MISIIIPTLNESRRLGAVLDALAGEPVAHEIIVADGGSSDASPEMAAAAPGVRLIMASPGRGQQLHAAGERAIGDIVFFLHADSRFPAGGLAAIEKALADPAVVGGNFRLLFDGDTAFSRWLNGFYAWIRRRGLYYGDSGIFVRREVYQSLGGIRPIALMEDYDFVRRLEKAGRTVCIDEPPLVTSSRKFENRAAPAIIWGWLKLHGLYHLGVSPDRLARMYYGPRHPIAGTGNWRERNA